MSQPDDEDDELPPVTNLFIAAAAVLTAFLMVRAGGAWLEGTGPKLLLLLADLLAYAFLVVANHRHGRKSGPATTLRCGAVLLGGASLFFLGSSTGHSDGWGCEVGFLPIFLLAFACVTWIVVAIQGSKSERPRHVPRNLK
ncbi:MAG TPA: hypothetical protein VLX28_26255 [Thermoanaerobaculia bacterium]|nr:hypothetical protein [Thermoanaerobaculia bacterium]